MDFSSFSLENFDYKTWINDFICKCAPENLEKELTDVIIKLQFCMQDVNGLVDESVYSLCQTLPRLMRELENIRQEAFVLQEQMSLVKVDIEKVEQSTQDSMRNLLKLHHQRDKLNGIQQSLREVDNWSEVCSSLDSVIKSEDVYKMSEKIQMLQQILSRLSSTPDYTERKLKLDHLCNSFESILGPKLIQAFYNHDSSFIRQAITLFDCVGLKKCSEKYYKAWFQPTVKQIWSNVKSRTSDWKTNQQLLSNFYKDLYEFVDKEISNILLSDGQNVIMNCLSDTLLSLEIEFDAVVSQHCVDISESKKRLNFLASILEITDELSVNLETSLSNVMSDSTTIQMHHLSNIIYSQLKGVNEVFAKECAQFANNKFNQIKMDSLDIGESVDLLDKSVDGIISLVQEVLDYCWSVTRFTALDSLVIIIKDLFNDYIKEFKRVCVNITLKLSNNNESKDMRSDSNDTDMDQYFIIQDGIRLTAVGGHISIKFEEFIQEMMSKIMTNIKAICGDIKSKSVYFRNYPEILVESVQLRRKIIDNWNLINQIDIPSQLMVTKMTSTSPFLLTSLESMRQTLKFELLQWLNKLVFDKVIQPIQQNNLSGLPTWPIWIETTESGQLLPQYAYSPQEYITKIGQFFLTLPQQLEPFINLTNNKQHMRYYDEALRNGQLPYISNNCLNQWLSIKHDIKVPSQISDDNEITSIPVAHIWLDSVVTGCLESLIQQWTSIPSLTIAGKQQMHADINYIIGLVEDLDLEIPEDLKYLSKLIVSDNTDVTQIDAAQLSQRLQTFVTKLTV